MTDDYDEIDVLIDTDPIALGQRCRRAEKDRAFLLESMEAIAKLDPGASAVAQIMQEQAARVVAYLAGSDKGETT